MEILAENLDLGMAIVFNRVIRLGNKVEDRMANLGTKTHRAIKAKDWSEVMNTMVRGRSIDLRHQI